MNFVRSTKSKFRLVQAITLMFTIVFYLMGMLVTPMSAGAVGDLEDLKAIGEVDLTAYTFDEICSKSVPFPDDFEALKNGSAIQRGMYYNFKSAQEYSKWLSTAKNCIEVSTGGASGANGVVFIAKPSKKDKEGKTHMKDENDPLSFTEEAWAEYNACSNRLTRIMARGAGERLVGDVFGGEFDPTNAVTLAAMRTFTMVCNTIFNTVAKALMLLFLAQTGFDVMYLTLPFTQGFLAPANASSGAGGSGVAQGKKFALRFNIVSNEAIDANNRSSTGSVGSNGATGGGFLQTNIFMRYIIARAPLILLAFTYFVLVATNVWTSLISGCTSLITGIFYGL